MKDLDSSRNGLGKWISQNDIQQGELGDCYLLSSISSLACRYPDKVLELFITRNINPSGIYCVQLCIEGQWRAIYVDDAFPLKYGKPVFTHGDREIWTMVLEKAWAKVYGSYSNICSGRSRYDLCDIMQRGVESIDWVSNSNIKS